MKRFLVVAALLCLVVPTVFAQDPVKVDSKHYTVVFENERVRVLRIAYGPHDKSVMHEHPDAVAVFLTDLMGKFTFPDGKTENVNAKAGDATWNPGAKHLPENLAAKPMALILVEIKGKAMPAKKP